MRILPYSEVSPADWNNACDQSSEAWLFHRSEWIQLEAAHFGYINRSFAIIYRQRIVAVQPLYISDSTSGAADEKLVHSGIHRHTGLACIDTLNSGLVHAVRTAAMSNIKSIARINNADRIQLNSQNLAPANRIASGREEIPFWVLDYGFYLGLNFAPTGISPAPGMATCNADQVINLQDSEQELFARLDESCRRAIRKARKSGLEFTIPETNPITRYYHLAQLSAQRTGESLAPFAYFEDLWRSLWPQQRCAIAIVQHEGRDVAALLLGIDKGAATYLGGVSDPAALHLRVNDFMHFEAMLWLKKNGIEAYRLGPIFPEVPKDWPIARVSRFKRKFGGRSVPIIQGSYFLSPERYLDRGTKALIQRCTPIAEPAVLGRSYSKALILAPKADRDAFSIILACYGLARGIYDFGEDQHQMRNGSSVVLLAYPGCNLPGIEIRHETRRQYLYKAGQCNKWWRRFSPPIYRTLMPHNAFSGPGIEPIWVTDNGRAVVAWQRNSDGKRNLLIGLDIVAEIIRYRQGDPAKVNDRVERNGFGYDFERPDYLYRDQIDPALPHIPWADRLGFMLAECIAELAGAPLLEPIPKGLKGLVVLTGDDDQAYLDKYAEQLAYIGDLPITYFLVPKTRHTSKTLGDLPKQVEIGVHVDALEDPENYDEICQRQTQFIRELSNQPVLTVRNHGYLNRGYLGQLFAWEKAGLIADVNCPGTDGTALNGSLLPMRVRRIDGTWSTHMSLLTAFGDGMLFALKLSKRQSVRRIRRSVRMIETGNPGVLVFNLHPQNIKESRTLHAEVVKLTRKPGWAAMKLGEFLEWFTVRCQVTASRVGNDWKLYSHNPIESLVARVKNNAGWHKVKLPTVTQSGIMIKAQS